MSESSEDYQTIVGHFLDSRREWQSLPQVVYLTIKAMFQHCQSLEEKMLCHQQLITEQSIRMRELDVELKSLAEKNFNIDYIEQIPFKPQTGFRKNKKTNDKQFSSIKRQIRSQSNKKARANQIQSHLKSFRSFSQDKEINQIAIQQIKNLAELMINEKINQESKNHTQNLNNFRQQTNRKIQQTQQKIKKQIGKFQQNLNHNLDQKVRQIQKQLASKSQIQRGNIVKFVEENAVQTQKLWSQLSQIHNRVNQFIEQYKLCYSNPVYLKAEKQNDIQQRTKKAGQRLNNQKAQQDIKNQDKSSQFYCNLNAEFKQFKLKMLKDCAGFIRGQQIQSILAKYQKQVNDRIHKLGSSISIIEKEFQSARRQALIKNQSKSSIPHFKTLEQEEKSRTKKGKSQESLRQIQESLQKLEHYFKQKMKSQKKQLISQVQKKLQQQQVNIRNELKQQMQFRQKSMCDIVQTNCDKIMKYHDRGGSAQEAVNLKKTVQKLSQQMILARFLHFGERQCRQVIEWQKNIYNSMEENFIWKSGSHIVQVMASGLYRVEVGLYPDNQAERIQAYLVLNGQPISSLKHKQTPSNSKAIARGSTFNQAILIPAKSKITIKVQLPFFGQAYLQIHKL